MYGDFSRDSFDPAKHYTRVLQQQGRPLTDADWNEQTSILARREWSFIRSLLRDDQGTFDGGFFPTYDSGPKTLGIKKGTYFVRGLQCETEDDVVAPVVSLFKEEKDCWLLYLDAWERIVMATEDQALLEPSLGGHDTAVRTKLRWAIRAEKLVDKDGVPAADLKSFKAAEWTKDKNNSAKKEIRSRCKTIRSPQDVCKISSAGDEPSSGETLYRVEVHQAGVPYVLDEDLEGFDKFMTFKWSRENGATVLGVGKQRSPISQVTIESRGGKSQPSAKVGDYVELFDQLGRDASAERRLGQVKSVNGNVLAIEPALNLADANDARTVLLSEPFPGNDGSTPGGVKSTEFFLRCWNQNGLVVSDPVPSPAAAASPANSPARDPREDISQQSKLEKLSITSRGVALAVVGKDAAKPVWLELENGVQISFEMGVQYSEGDYWLIRTSAHSFDGFWPPRNAADGGRKERSLPLSGRHLYAPLISLSKDDSFRMWIGRKLGDYPPVELDGELGKLPPTHREPLWPVAGQAPVDRHETTPAVANSREPILSAVGLAAFHRLAAAPEKLTRAIPARYLNHEPRSASYARFRSALLVSDILKDSFGDYWATIERCMSLTEAERALIEDDARADYDLAVEFQKQITAQRLSSRIA